MISRTLSAPLLLAASVGVPYVASNAPEWTEQIRGAAAAAPAHTQPMAAAPMPPLPSTTVPESTAPPQGPGPNLFPTQTPLEGSPSYSICEVLRMDVSKEWIYQRWPRKSTALAELDLFGVRVPLVTGTQLYDLAGSLTYYFGADGRVKRITFTGRTGDTTHLAAIAHQRFGLTAQPTAIAGEQLLQYRNGDDVFSELRTSPAPVLWANTPHDSFAVDLVLQDPASAQPLQSRQNPASAARGLAKPAPTTAATTTPKANVAPNAAAPAAAPAAEAPEPLGWKAFFPRSRLPKAQVNNLDQANLYQ